MVINQANFNVLFMLAWLTGYIVNIKPKWSETFPDPLLSGDWNEKLKEQNLKSRFSLVINEKMFLNLVKNKHKIGEKHVFLPSGNIRLFILFITVTFLTC